MKRFWTADMHLGHGNIIEYCQRPFKDCDHMNVSLIRNANQRVKIEDTVVHVGDFAMKDGWKYRSMLNGNWCFVRGNHDANNKVKPMGDWFFTRVGHFTVFVSHVPYFYRHEERTANFLLPEAGIQFVESWCDFAVCGHVHEKWMVSREGALITINVGTDQHRFMPIDDQELLNIFLREKANGNG